jgi:peptidoglycan/LPS O-acetylase OafA/YrhL
LVALPRTLPYVDGVRALAALFVMLGHTWFQPTNGYYPERWMNKLGLSHGHLAVDVFIVVSGFVIGYPIATKSDRIDSLSGFFRRRMRRILPPYYAALALCTAFILFVAHERTGTVWDNSLPLTWESLLMRALLLHDLPIQVPGGLISYQLWSIAVEFHIYLLTPLLVLSVRRLGAVATLTITVGASALIHSLWPQADTLTHWYVALFLLGFLAVRIAVKSPNAVRGMRTWGIASLALTGFVLLALGNTRAGAFTLWFDVAVGAGTAAVLASLFSEVGSSGGSWLFRALSSRALVWVGGFSYSLYLIHPAVLQLEWLLLRELEATSSPIQTFFVLAFLSPVVIAASWLFHVAFESPFMNKARARAAETVATAARAPAPAPQG